MGLDASMNTPRTAESSLDRRRFLAWTGAAAGTWLLSGTARAASPAGGAPVRGTPPIGIELYAVRDSLAKDLPATLTEVARLGYKVVEFYSPYFGWTMPYAKEVRTRLDDLGLRCLSTHNGLVSFAPGDGINRAIELNQILGARHIVLASAGREPQGAEGWKKLCEQLSAATQQLQPHGLTAGFHNHQTEWAKVDGEQRIMDLIAANTPPEFVLQLDVGTCLHAGADPVAWIKANPGRIRSIHLKDWTPGDDKDGKGYRVLFGEGIAPWPDLIRAVESVGGLEFYLMEQEGSRYGEFETARLCLEKWHALRATL
jgi:sugar phosphate isomerase/epimerase